MDIFENKKTKVVTIVETSYFSRNLTEKRKAAGLTQEELARRLGTPGDNHSRVCNWEKGNSIPKLKDFVRLCNIFKVSPNDMLGFTNE